MSETEQTRQMESAELEASQDVNFNRHITIAVAIVVLAGILVVLMEAT